MKKINILHELVPGLSSRQFGDKAMIVTEINTRKYLLNVYSLPEVHVRVQDRAKINKYDESIKEFCGSTTEI